MKQAVDSGHKAVCISPSHSFGGSLGSIAGLCIALLIGGSWLGHLWWLLSSVGIETSGVFVLGGILCQTFLNTGLFITVHDAIHGLVCPQYPKINRALGECFATAYACFSYESLAQKHWLHHSSPMTASDPDVHPSGCTHFWPWYCKFLREYSNANQFLNLAFILFFIIFIGQVSLFKLVVFWAIPLGLSSLQLFYFGTYIPHRIVETFPGSQGCITSQARPWLVSLLTCYHFSYHQEHHENPGVPWWLLPSLYRSLQAQSQPQSGYFTKDISQTKLGRCQQPARLQ